MGIMGCCERRSAGRTAIAESAGRAATVTESAGRAAIAASLSVCQVTVVSRPKLLRYQTEPASSHDVSDPSSGEGATVRLGRARTNDDK